VPRDDAVQTIDLSHYRPTPDERRFSISTFAISGHISWESKPGGAFSARLQVVKGALAKLLPFKSMEAGVQLQGGEKVYSLRTIDGKSDDDKGNDAGKGVGNSTLKEKRWPDTSVLSPIEIPWVVEYAFKQRSVGGPKEGCFQFEDNQRVRSAVVFFRDDEDADLQDGIGVLRVMKPGEKPASISDTQNDSQSGDVVITFRDSKIVGFSIIAPIVGKLLFVAV
jgi:hypothetical protein